MLNVSLFAVLIYMVPINRPSTHTEIPTGRRRHLTRVHRNWRHCQFVVIFEPPSFFLPFLSFSNQLTQPFFISHPNTYYYLNLHVCFCLHFSFSYNVSSEIDLRGNALSFIITANNCYYSIPLSVLFFCYSLSLFFCFSLFFFYSR